MVDQKGTEKCPCCGYVPAKDEIWCEWHSVSLVAGPALDVVFKCKKCNGRFVAYQQSNQVDLIRYAHDMIRQHAKE